MSGIMKCPQHKDPHWGCYDCYSAVKQALDAVEAQLRELRKNRPQQVIITVEKKK